MLSAGRPSVTQPGLHAVSGYETAPLPSEGRHRTESPPHPSNQTALTLPVRASGHTAVVPLLNTHEGHTEIPTQGLQQLLQPL